MEPAGAIAMKLGYARVSTERQDLQGQVDQLQAADVDRERIYTDHLSGKSAKNRPGLQQMLGALRADDKVVITKLDRLGRSLWDLQQLAQQIEDAGAHLEVVDQQIDTSTPGGRLMFQMIGAVAEFERSMILERTQQGRERAKRQGKHLGRHATFTEKDRRRAERLLRDPETTVADVAEAIGCSRSTVYRMAGGVEGVNQLRQVHAD